MKNLGSESQVVPEVLVADQVRWSRQRPCRSAPADQVPPMGQAALRATWMPSLWAHVAWAPLDLPVELAAAKAAVERLAPLAPLVEMVAEERLAVQLEAWLADVVDLDHVAAAVVVEPISTPAKHCEMPAVGQRHHLERGPW